jgi:hypothetical protein
MASDIRPQRLTVQRGLARIDQLSAACHFKLWSDEVFLYYNPDAALTWLDWDAKPKG